MQSMKWTGVIPALTTNLTANGAVDHEAFAAHCEWMIRSGCSGVVCCGSLGEAQTLSFDEKLAVLDTCIKAVAGRVPVVLGVASVSTAGAVTLAEAGAKAGVQGLMVLPPYVYSAEWPEMKAHVSAVFKATTLSCMLYNNPPAYKTDFLPEHIVELAAEHPNFHAVKESTGDIRRVTAIRALAGDRVAVLIGIDDAVVEGIYAGAVGWIAGLPNAFPVEAVALFNLASSGEKSKAAALYAWFLPLLRLDGVPKFVQYIKWFQAQVGRGTPFVRAPRLELTGADLALAKDVLRSAQASRPSF